VVPASVAPVLAARRQGPRSRVAKPGRVTIIDLIDVPLSRMAARRVVNRRSPN